MICVQADRIERISPNWRLCVGPVSLVVEHSRQKREGSLTLSQWITLHVTNGSSGSAPATTTTTTDAPDDTRRRAMAAAATTKSAPVVLDEDWEEWSPEKGSFLHHMMAGSAAGVAEHVSIFPIDTIKVRS